VKHSIPELIETVYLYFPRGLQGDEASYTQTPEYLRRMQARVPASARFRDWVLMLNRIEPRLPTSENPELIVHNGSPFLASPTASHIDRCFSGALSLPPRGEWEEVHKLEFMVSFVVPYYVIYSMSFAKDPQPVGGLVLGPDITFDFSADEAPFVDIIREEVLATFPDYETMPPEVGKTIVPDVIGGGNLYGESTIYGCLFSDNW
jgi:hypothetical protein